MNHAVEINPVLSFSNFTRLHYPLHGFNYFFPNHFSFSHKTLSKQLISSLAGFCIFSFLLVQEGKGDPVISLIKVIPEEAYYRNTKDNRMISLIKFAMGAMGITPKDDGGVEGKLKA